MLNTTNNTNNTETSAIVNVLEALFNIILDALNDIAKADKNIEFRYMRVGGYSTLTREVQVFVVSIFDVNDPGNKREFTKPLIDIPVMLWTSINSEVGVLIKFPMSGFDQIPVDPDGWYIPSRGFVPASGCRAEARWYFEELQAYWESEFGDESGK